MKNFYVTILFLLMFCPTAFAAHAVGNAASTLVAGITGNQNDQIANITIYNLSCPAPTATFAGTQTVNVLTATCTYKDKNGNQKSLDSDFVQALAVAFNYNVVDGFSAAKLSCDVNSRRDGVCISFEPNDL